MTNLALKYPHLAELETRITSIRTLATGDTAVECEESMLHAAAGGQPCDHGMLACDAGEYRIIDVVEAGENAAWLVVSRPPPASLRSGDRVTLRLDTERRRLLSRSHSAVHLLMAVIRQQSRRYENHGAEISEDGGSATLRFHSDAPLDDRILVAVIQAVRSHGGARHKILAEDWPTVKAARAAYSYWRDDPDWTCGSSVRVIHIEGVDATPCVGTHVRRTDEIGPYAITALRSGDGGLQKLSLRLGESWNNWYAETC